MCNRFLHFVRYYFYCLTIFVRQILIIKQTLVEHRSKTRERERERERASSFYSGTGWSSLERDGKNWRQHGRMVFHKKFLSSGSARFHVSSRLLACSENSFASLRNSSYVPFFARFYRFFPKIKFPKWLSRALSLSLPSLSHSLRFSRSIRRVRFN